MESHVFPFILSVYCGTRTVQLSVSKSLIVLQPSNIFCISFFFFSFFHLTTKSFNFDNVSSTIPFIGLKTFVCELKVDIFQIFNMRFLYQLFICFHFTNVLFFLNTHTTCCSFSFVVTLHIMTDHSYIFLLSSMR